MRRWVALTLLALLMGLVLVPQATAAAPDPGQDCKALIPFTPRLDATGMPLGAEVQKGMNWTLVAGVLILIGAGILATARVVAGQRAHHSEMGFLGRSQLTTILGAAFILGALTTIVGFMFQMGQRAGC